VQAKVLPVSEKTLDYGRGVLARLGEAGLRAELDESNEKLGYKIRQAQLHKVPYMVVVGEQEAAGGTVAVRMRSGREVRGLAAEGFVRWLATAARQRSPALPEPAALA
jgi:threonyl-tRNA synthetase